MTTTPIIQTNNLRYAYRPGEPVLQGLNLRVPTGSIYGFLGANGSGKSTTIRLLLGLLRVRSGGVSLFGTTYPHDRTSILRRTGSLIEAPSLYEHLSGRQNLQIIATYLRVSPTRTDQCLELTGMTYAADRKCGDYSMGMKQRIGLAMALLSDPELLILDEPTSGLDPQGIREIREIIRRLHAAGKTIFLSSHLLSEIEKTATRVGILRAGRLVFEGELSELHRQRRGESVVRIRLEAAREIAERLPADYPCKLIDTDMLEVRLNTSEDAPELLAELVRGGARIHAFEPVRHDLENAFFQLTNEQS